MVDYTEKGIIFPVCYFPAVSWHAYAVHYASFQIETFQHFRKQEYTNRMFVRASNKVLPLTIPIERRGTRVPIKDKKISYREDWQRQHWRTILFAYTHSPYFEYYRDTLEPLYMRRTPFLMDFLRTSLEIGWELLKWKPAYSFTESYKSPESYKVDLRRTFDPKREIVPQAFSPTPYTQVFEGFSPDLSVLDLLFNEGPNSLEYLKNAYSPIQTQ